MSGQIINKIGLILFSLIVLFGCQIEENPNKNEEILKNTIDKLILNSENQLSQDADSAIWYAQQASHLSRDLKNESTLNSLYILSRALYNKGNLYNALKTLIQANEIAINLNLNNKISEIQNMQGNIYGSLGQYDKAVESYLSALSLYQELNDIQNEAKAYNNLGLVFYRMNQIDKSYNFHLQAMAIWDSLGYEIGLGSSYTNLAYVYSEKEEFTTAIDYLNKALQIYQTAGNLRREANTYINYGWVYMNLKDYQRALENFNKSLPMSKNGGFNDIYADGLNKKGLALFKLKRYDEATATLLQGLNIAVEIKDPSLINEINLALTELYSSIGDYKSALQYQQRWSTIKDSIFQDKSAEYIALFEVMYKTEAKEKRIEILEETNKRRAMMVRFSIFLAILLLIVIILVFSRYRMKVKYLNQEKVIREKTLKQKELQVELEKSKNDQLEAEKKLQDEENKKLQLDIQHRHSELSSITLHLYQKNESLSRLLEEVDKIQKQADPESKQKIRKLKQIINRNLSLDEDWNNFKMYFDQVHHGFIDRLYQNYKELTNHDLRHCSYIKMNLSTKEISRLLNINPTSVQKSRVRLKKKLNLGQDEDLYKFLSQY